MKLPLVMGAALLCAVRAEGNDSLLTPHATGVLTPIDEVPTKAALTEAFGSADGLRAIALDRSIDVGVQLRAIRALPTLCPDPPAACPAAHDTLAAIIAAEQGAPRVPASTVRLRAAIEAFGALRSGNVGDVGVVGTFLGAPDPAQPGRIVGGDPSRDIRTAAARALRGMCTADARDRLSGAYSGEQIAQVKLEIQQSLTALRACLP